MQLIVSTYQTFSLWARAGLSVVLLKPMSRNNILFTFIKMQTLAYVEDPITMQARVTLGGQLEVSTRRLPINLYQLCGELLDEQHTLQSTFIEVLQMNDGAEVITGKFEPRIVVADSLRPRVAVPCRAELRKSSGLANSVSAAPLADAADESPAGAPPAGDSEPLPIPDLYQVVLDDPPPEGDLGPVGSYLDNIEKVYNIDSETSESENEPMSYGGGLPEHIDAVSFPDVPDPVPPPPAPFEDPDGSDSDSGDSESSDVVEWDDEMLQLQQESGAPWPKFKLPDGLGSLVWDYHANSLGAHCNAPGHKLCRINKKLKFRPVGYLLAWLRAGKNPAIKDKKSHML